MADASETLETNEAKSEGSTVEAIGGYASFGKFQLVARLGKGGMGDVYLALARGMEGFKKLVVIKRLHETLIDDARSRSLFLEEGRLAARLNHPNVVQTNEVGELDGALFMSMEYLEGQTCLHVARHWKANANPRMVARIIADALAGLHYAHELSDYDGTPLKIVHRDLSPHNIFITYDGVVKLLDFGIAKAAVQSSKTEVGVFKGKVAYMAPEQLQEAEIDRRVDIFVIGIVLWESLSSQRLFKAEGVAKTFQALLYAPIPRLSTVVPGIDPALEAIVARALERAPGDRYQTAQELRDALEAYLAASGPPVRQEDIGALVRQLFQQRREWVRERVRMFMSAVQETSSTQHLPSLALSRRENEWSSRSGILPIPANDAGPEERKPLRRWMVVCAAGAAAVAALAAGFLLASARARPALEAPALQEAQEHPVVAAAPAPAAPAPAALAAAAPAAVTPNTTAAPPPAAPALHDSHVNAASHHTAPEQPAPEASPAPHPVAPSTTSMATSAPVPAATAASPAKRKFRTEL